LAAAFVSGFGRYYYFYTGDEMEACVSGVDGVGVGGTQHAYCHICPLPHHGDSVPIFLTSRHGGEDCYGGDGGGYVGDGTASDPTTEGEEGGSVGEGGGEYGRQGVAFP